MAFQVLVIVAGLISGWIRKGSLWSIVNIRLKWIWVAPVAYILQHISIRYFSGTTYEVTVLLSYLALLLFCIVNLRVTGSRWAFCGILANLVAMSVNGLRMPAYRPAVEKITPWAVPLLEKGSIGKSVLMSSHTHFNFLGDIFLFNVWPQSIISIGDILFGVGLAILIQSGMTSNKGGEESINGDQWQAS